MSNIDSALLHYVIGYEKGTTSRKMCFFFFTINFFKLSPFQSLKSPRLLTQFIGRLGLLLHRSNVRSYRIVILLGCLDHSQCMKIDCPTPVYRFYKLIKFNYLMLLATTMNYCSVQYDLIGREPWGRTTVNN